MQTVAERIAEARSRLTKGELRVAEAVLDGPQAVAFGTVATLAGRASTSAPTVVRFAGKLGFAGFTALQAAVQDELSEQLRPASELIRRTPAGDPLARALDIELENVRATLAGVDRGPFGAAVRLLASSPRVWILSGEATRGVARMFADGLGMLRDGVGVLTGSPVRVVRDLAEAGPSDVLLAIDLRRYERWVLDTVRVAELERIAITDALHSPLARLAGHAFVVSARGAGPFDSHVGTLALCNALLAGVAAARRRAATRRLDRIEAVWTSARALTDG